jgi:hypothetical protein
LGSFGGCYQPIAFVGDNQQVVGVGGCLATRGKPPCLWVYSDGTGRYVDETGTVRPLWSTSITGSATISSCSSAHSGEFEATTSESVGAEDSGRPLNISGRFRACPEGPLVL